MNVAVLHTPQWTISTRRRGEVLAASVASDGLELGVFSVPDGFTGSELEGWLRDLIGVAHETARADSQPRPIPTLLHHVLTGLLFSHAELWEPAGVTAPCSVAFVSGEDEVGFGWVGEASVQIWLNDLPLDPGWVRIRDDAGRQALAISLDARSRVRIRLEWSSPADGERGAVLDAQWPFVEVAEVAPPAALEPEAAPESVAPAPETVALAPESVAPLPSGRPPATLEKPAPVASEDSIQVGTRAPRVESAAPPALDAPAVTAVESARTGRRAGRLASAMGRISSWWTRKPREVEPDAPPVTAAPRTPALAGPPARPAGIEAWDPHLRSLGAPATPPSSGPPVLRMPATRSPHAPPAAAPPSSAPANVAPPLASGPRILEADVDTPPRPGLVAPPSLGTETPQVHAAVPPRPSQAPPATASAPAPSVARAAPGELPIPEPTPGAIEDWIARELAAQAVRPAPPVSVAPSPAARIESEPPPVVASSAERVSSTIDPPPAEPAMRAAREPEAAATPVSAAAPEASVSAPPMRAPMRPQWPSAAEAETPAPLWQRPWVWVVVMLALFAGGWLVGGRSTSREPSTAPQGVGRALRALGLGGAHFDVMTNSRPEGAWIAVDGKDLARRTPGSLDLPAGRHVVTLSFADLGSASYTVTGERGQQLAIDAPMWGSLIVRESDSGLPVTVELDGRALGYAPVVLDSVLPGAHELRFSGPGMVPWGQTVEVKVRQQAEVLAHPMTSPANGVIEVRATVVDDSGEQPLTGGEVWIDGELRGRAPLTLDLPRGPHSVRVSYHGESAPVQVIDLPGGNQRFANFELGVGVDRPRLVAVGIPDHMAPDQPAVASAALNGVTYTDVKEMWLHVRTPEGPWRRYQMEILKSTFGAIGVAVYPATLFDDQGTSHYYTSALTASGDEYFTEIATIRLETPRKPEATH